jgi:lipopolysaccharide transport system permease protein
MVVFKVPVYPPGWLFLPVILAILLILIMGLGLALSALNVFYRDVRSLLVLGLQLWFYASPIIYPISLVPDWLRPYYFLNPMAGIITAFRDVLLYQRLPGSYLSIAGFISLVMFIVGFWFFKRVEFQFADIV